AAVTGIRHAHLELARDVAAVLVEQRPRHRVVVQVLERCLAERGAVPALHRLASTDLDATGDHHHRVLGVQITERVPVLRGPALERHLLVALELPLELLARPTSHRFPPWSSRLLHPRPARFPYPRISRTGSQCR